MLRDRCNNKDRNNEEWIVLWLKVISFAFAKHTLSNPVW